MSVTLNLGLKEPIIIGSVVRMGWVSMPPKVIAIFHLLMACSQVSHK